MRMIVISARFCMVLLLSVGLSGCMVTPLQQEAAAPTPSAAATTVPRATTPPAPRASEQPPASLSARPGRAPADASGAGLTRVKGSFTYSNDVITTYYVEHAVGLFDMYGFVTRDEEWETPIDSQVIGFLEMDTERKRGEFALNLPALPRGTAVDVDNNGTTDAGVQVFVIAYNANVTGGPFSEGDDAAHGWPSYLASTVNDPENDDEVTGGQLLVWSPDDQQEFPTGFGADKLLFTADDPVGPLPAGYALIDLDQAPFAVTQRDNPDMTLHEPADAGVKDFSDQSYTEAFANMFERVRREYAFNGIEGKQPDYDKLYAELMPRVSEAERQRDDAAFFRALYDFTQAFKDGHVGLSGGDYAGQLLRAQAISGYGLAIRELDDKRVIVTYVLDDGPAARAGINVGATVTRWNNQPIGEAISAVTPIGGPYSTEFARRYDQQQFLVRAPERSQVTIEWTNEGETAKTATLRSTDEIDSFYAFDATGDNYDADALPVEARTLESGIGYIQITSNYDDLNLIIRLFERALDNFEQSEAPGLILDLRRNGGGSQLGLASYFLEQEIEMAQIEYFSEVTGKFEPRGEPWTIEPAERRFRFPKMAVLVNKDCASACELEAYGFSKVPGMLVIGQYPTAGVEAEVSRGQFELPAGLSLQVPTGRMVLPDGSIFLEGVGVEPTVRVPINEQTVLTNADVVLQAAEDAILNP